MSKRKVEQHLVIFYRLERTVGTKKYYDESGNVTGNISNAMRFDSYEDAKAFVVKHDILLGIMTYIGRETFSENERQQPVA